MYVCNLSQEYQNDDLKDSRNCNKKAPKKFRRFYYMNKLLNRIIRRFFCDMHVMRVRLS